MCISTSRLYPCSEYFLDVNYVFTNQRYEFLKIRFYDLEEFTMKNVANSLGFDCISNTVKYVSYLVEELSTELSST